MASTFTWLDYSEHERRKMLDVVKLFGERDTRDELGVGSVRDALSDLFFPGTSTIQTRARYFLFVPWIYLDLEKKRTDPGKIADRARRQEVVLINALLESGETEGVIGRQARDRLLRLPSNIYWQGMGVLGLRLFRGSQDQYHRSLSGHYAHVAYFNHQRAEEITDLFINSNWHPGIPPAPANFPSKITFALSRVEAEYLRERIQTHARDTLMSFWVSRRSPPLQAVFPWEIVDDHHPEHLRDQLAHAQNFSESIHGAALLYNLMLAEQIPHTDWVDRYRSLMDEWIELIQARLPAFTLWDREKFWEIVYSINPRVPHFTRAFVDQWLEPALDPVALPTIADDPAARGLIRLRERSLKRGQARLENRRALDLWNGSAGTGRLDFRWGVAQSHLLDIHNGLQTR
jgi:Family of unknown function (DUF6361)